MNTGSTLALGEPPVAANKCGTSISNPFSSNTSSGLYFARGTLPINTYGAPFTIDSNVFPSFQAVGLTTTTSYGAFTRNEFIPYRTPQFVGFIKSAAWERHYPDISVIDVNDANTGVGNDKREFNTRLGSGIVDGSGAILTSDGFQDLRSLVPSLQIDGRLVQALAINNHGQIAVKTCLVSFYGGCSDYKLHLLTPQ